MRFIIGEHHLVNVNDIVTAHIVREHKEERFTTLKITLRGEQGERTFYDGEAEALWRQLRSHYANF